MHAHQHSQNNDHLHSPSPRRARPSTWMLWAAVSLVVCAYGAVTALHVGNALGWIVVADLGEVLAASTAAAACLVRAHRERKMLAPADVEHAGEAARAAPERRAALAWTLLAAGMALWGLGAAIVSFYEIALTTHVPEPSVADAAFLLSYAGIGGGLLAFVRTPAGGLSLLRGAVEALFIACGFLLFSWTLVIDPVFDRVGALSLASGVNLAYPVLDAFTLAAVLFVVLQCRHSLPVGLGLLAVGVIMLMVSDSAWWYLNTVDSNLASVSPVETGWVAGFLLVALAAHSSTGPQRKRVQRPGGRLVLIAPSLPALCGVTILLVEVLVVGNVEWQAIVLVLTSAVVLLAVALLLTVSYENHALTGHLERRVAQRTAELQRTERYYRALVQNSSDLVMVIDAALTIRYVSDSTDRVFGFAAERLLGQQLDVFGKSAQDALSEELDVTRLQPGQVRRVEWTLTDATGRQRSAESTITNQVDDPHVGGFVLNTRDDTDRSALADQLRSQAFHDPLTGLANRALLADRAAQAFARAGRSGAFVALIVVDLDAFKLINDGFGHQVGDELLCQVGARLQGTVRPEDTVARLGGDEFVVLMDSTPDVDTALVMAERVRSAVLADVAVEGGAHLMSASVGVAVGLPRHANFDQLLSDADVALYAVKSSGRNAVRLFQSNIHRDGRERLQMQADLRKAIESGELCLFYQPEFSADGERLDGFEALVRWQHPERGLMGPDAFIPLAEETGLVVPLGRWVLGEALGQAVAWAQAHPGHRPLNISVNVSAVQLSTPSIVADVASALQRSGIDPGCVVLEVTESSFISCSTPVIDTLRALKNLGVRLAIDDFGTGYASVSVLRGMPIDILKIDKSFVASIDDGEHGNDLLEAIVNIGQVLSLVTIAEGIEEPSQLRVANKLGCDLVQGYLLGRPLPADQAARLIVARASAKAPLTQVPMHSAER